MIKKWFFALCRITIVLLSFFIGNLSTVHPVQISGNGNPALLFIPILLFLALFIVNDWIKMLKYLNPKSISLIVLLFIIAIALSIGYNLQVDEFYERKDYVQQVVLERENGMSDPLYLKRVTGIKSTYMSNQLFNFNTLIMYFLLTISIAIIYILWTRREVATSSRHS